MSVTTTLMSVVIVCWCCFAVVVVFFLIFFFLLFFLLLAVVVCWLYSLPSVFFGASGNLQNGECRMLSAVWSAVHSLKHIFGLLVVISPLDGLPLVFIHF